MYQCIFSCSIKPSLCEHGVDSDFWLPLYDDDKESRSTTTTKNTTQAVSLLSQQLGNPQLFVSSVYMSVHYPLQEHPIYYKQLEVYPQ